MPLVELTFARHGQTQKNIDGVLQGHLDTSLNEKGLEDAKKLSECIKNFKFDVIFSSDLTRALQCANKIRKHFPNTEFVKEPLLRERNFGYHQGKKLTDLGYSDLSYTTMVKHLYQCECPHGETNNQVIDRIKRFMEKCFNEYDGKKILVVTHGGIVMLALNYIFGEIPIFKNRREHDNCDVSYVKISNDLELFDSLVNIHCKILAEREA